MGVLSYLFKSSGTQDEGAGRRTDKKAAMPPLSLKLSINVFLRSGRHLFDGRIADFSDGELSIERLPGQLSLELCEPGDELRVRGLAANGKPYELMGVVVQSSRVFCKLEKVEMVMHSENRSNFRLPLECDISVYAESDTKLAQPELCRLVNISVGGACFQSEYVQGLGEVLRMEIRVAKYAPMVFLGQVIRANEFTSGIFRYGFLFAQLGDQETDALNKILFNIQVGNRREWQQRNSDGWG